MNYKAKAEELNKCLNDLYTYSERGRLFLKVRNDLEKAFWGISRCGFSAQDMEGFIKKIQ